MICFIFLRCWALKAYTSLRSPLQQAFRTRFHSLAADTNSWCLTTKCEVMWDATMAVSELSPINSRGISIYTKFEIRQQYDFVYPGQIARKNTGIVLWSKRHHSSVKWIQTIFERKCVFIFMIMFISGSMPIYPLHCCIRHKHERFLRVARLFQRPMHTKWCRRGGHRAQLSIW